MKPQQLRIVYAMEFLLALVAIFTAWSEVGGQAVLDVMPWGWKLALSLLLAAAVVGFTAAVGAGERFWNLRSARWFAALLLCISAIAAVTYYYALQIDSGDPEENGTVSAIHPIRRLWQAS